MVKTLREHRLLVMLCLGDPSEMDMEPPQLDEHGGETIVAVGKRFCIWGSEVNKLYINESNVEAAATSHQQLN